MLEVFWLRNLCGWVETQAWIDQTALGKCIVFDGSSHHALHALMPWEPGSCLPPYLRTQCIFGEQQTLCTHCKKHKTKQL